MRDPNSPIPGFEEEFTGTAGHEKRIHRYMFGMPNKTWKSTGTNGKDWYRTGIGKYQLLTPTEARDRGLLAEVTDEQKKV